jgi:hypothetical protein
VFLLLWQTDWSSSLLLLNDLATPAFVVDLTARLQKTPDYSALPPVRTGPDCILQPMTGVSGSMDPEAPPVSLRSLGTCYWHCQVTRAREEATEEDAATFLAETDLSPETKAELVLGLNNHHVGSYYWARSAGAGAAMEAPGVVLKDSCLHWGSEAGPADCNSNDGKRSEWVNFLRRGDQLQLLPLEPLENLGIEAVYGVSSYERPLGSEPAVVCEWRKTPSRVR